MLIQILLEGKEVHLKDGWRVPYFGGLSLDTDPNSGQYWPSFDKDAGIVAVVVFLATGPGVVSEL